MKHVRTLLLTALPILAATQSAFADAALPGPMDRAEGILPAALAVAAAVIGAVLGIKKRKK